LVGPAILLLAFLYFWWIAGNTLELAGDEGIYLEGGRRMAMGQQPYRDFFALTGPLTFWMEGALARLSGMSLPLMRLPMILDGAFLVWAVYRFTSRYSAPFYAAGAAVTFMVYESRTRLLNVNHRWDSGALATAAVLAAWEASSSRRRGLWIASGALAAAAGWATPSVAIVAIPLFAWSARRSARGALRFLAGAATITAAAVTYLAAHRALVPMIQSLLWTSANYTAPNRVLYGSVWAGARPDIPAWQYLVTASLLALPALLPPAAIIGWAWFLRHGRGRADAAEILPLLGAAAALTLAAWPRWTSDTLLHTLALSWFLCAWLLYRLTAARQRYWLCGVVLLLAAMPLAGKLIAPLAYSTRETRVGSLRDADDNGEILDGLEHWVQPGDSLFSFPYLPAAYFYLQARNPTRYSFLQPGMMNAEDERRVVEQLKSDPPRWVIYEKFPLEAVFSIWPGSDPARIPMAAINGYISQSYRQVDMLAGPRGRLFVMERVPAAR